VCEYAASLRQRKRVAHTHSGSKRVKRFFEEEEKKKEQTSLHLPPAPGPTDQVHLRLNVLASTESFVFVQLHQST
jgi:hypothetical protein